MRIGILTFHRANNFGAVMQAYALQRYLMSCGHEALIIDYRCKAIERQYDIVNPRILWSRKNVMISLKNYLQRILNCRSLYQKRIGFEHFRQNHLILTEPVNCLNQAKEFDAYISGSDQVWNIYITGGVDQSYFLFDLSSNNAKRIAYAVSSSDDVSVFDSHFSEILSYISKFDSISVREDSLKEYLAPRVKQDVRVCVDPCFLLNAKDFDVLAKKENVAKPYILVYQMTRVDVADVVAEALARKYGLDVIFYYGGTAPHKRNHSVIKDPLDFLGKIKGAEMILTTSFHGIVFSTIFEKKFWAFNYDGNERQRNVLNLLKLQNRMVDSVDDVPWMEEIDYTDVHRALYNVVEESKRFLLESL